MEGPAGAVVAIIPLVLLFTVLSLLKTALRSFSRVALRRVADAAGGRVKLLLDEFLLAPAEFILRIQCVIQVALVSIAALATTAILHSGVRLPAALSIAALGVFVVALEHFFPFYVMSVDRERLLVRLLPAYGTLEPLAALLAWPASLLARRFRSGRLVPGAAGEVSDEAIRAYIDVGEEAGILDEGEGEMIESVVDFGETIVREVMTPRVDMVSAEGSKTVADVRDLIIESRHSRVPVWKERVDNVEGIVYIKDLLEAWRDGKEGERVAAWMKPTLFVPETKLVSSLLKEFQRGRTSFAIVVDEYGGTSGLVTIEDLLAEIVGEIRDEDGAKGQDVVEEPDGSVLFAGKVDVERVEELFGLSFDEADFETVAGLVFATLGRVPSTGEEFSIGELRFKVVDADRRRVNKVRVTKTAAAPVAPPSAS